MAFQPSDFVAVALLVALEGLLSAGNAMVLAVLVLGLPKAQQRKALRYGIGGGVAVRGVGALLAGDFLQLGGGELARAGGLLYLVFRHFFRSGGTSAPRVPPEAPPRLRR